MVEQIQSEKIVLQHADLWFDVKCTAPKATGLLSCLQMKVTSFRMKPK